MIDEDREVHPEMLGARSNPRGRYLVQTFGCQMNVHDSRRIEEVLGRAGWEPTDEPRLAGLVVFNTCSVREKAEHKLLSVLGSVRSLKEENPDLVIAVAGCVAQQEGEKLLAKAPYIDVVIGPDNIPELPGLVAHARDGGPPVARTVFDIDDPRFLDAVPDLAKARELFSFVTVMKGCDERCTFCIVPYTRGPERYRAADDIVREVSLMAAGGVREVTLLGQTVNSWFEPGSEDNESQFAALLRRIASEVPTLARLRYTSPHPRHITRELVCAHAELSVLPAHVHLPVQSGSNAMLRRMLRRYTRETYLESLAALRSARKDMTFSTDLIVGFPGETEADFEATLSLVQEAGFVSAFAFKYSPRPNTPALKLRDDVSEATKDDRLARLLSVIEAQQRAHLETLVDTQTEVLFEGPSQKGGATRFKGRSSRHEIVHVDVPPGKDPSGLLLPVRIVRANAHSLSGELEGANLGRLPDVVSAAREKSAPTGRVRLPVAPNAFRSGLS